MSFLDRFKNSEFASVRHHATMAEQEFKTAIIVSNDVLPPELQSHKEWEPSDNEDGGKFYGTDLLTIEKRLAKKTSEESEHSKNKREKESRIEDYAAQWDADQNKGFDYKDEGPKFHQNAVSFLRTVLSFEEFEDFEEEVENSL